MCAAGTGAPLVPPAAPSVRFLVGCYKEIGWASVFACVDLPICTTAHLVTMGGPACRSMLLAALPVCILLWLRRCHIAWATADPFRM